MRSDLVRWNDLHNIFEEIFPSTIRDVITNDMTAPVKWSGYIFEIRPRAGGTDFDVYGPPALESGIL